MTVEGERGFVRGDSYSAVKSHVAPSSPSFAKSLALSTRRNTQVWKSGRLAAKSPRSLSSSFCITLY